MVVRMSMSMVMKMMNSQKYYLYSLSPPPPFSFSGSSLKLSGGIPAHPHPKGRLSSRFCGLQVPSHYHTTNIHLLDTFSLVVNLPLVGPIKR